ncbi:unnamed protein product [Absidia cylindrospora]
MSFDSSYNKDQYEKQPTAFIVPTRRNKKPHDTPTNRTTVDQFCDDESRYGINKRYQHDGDDEVICVNESNPRLNTAESTAANYKNPISDNSGSDSENDTNIIDLTDSAHPTGTSLSPRPTFDFSYSFSPDLTPKGLSKKRGAVSPHAPHAPSLQLDVTPNAANKSKKTGRQKQKTTTTTTTIEANQQLHARPINTICRQLPDYESLTLVELRVRKKHSYAGTSYVRVVYIRF